MIPDPNDTKTMPIHHLVGSNLSFEHIYNRVLGTAKRKVQNEEDLERFLKSWWCLRYNRPYRDPMLQEYTLEELVVEYLDVSYRANPEAFAKAKEVEAQKKDDDDWAEKMADKFGEELLSPEDQVKKERDIEEAFERHAEEHEVEDLLTMGNVHHKFDGVE